PDHRSRRGSSRCISTSSRAAASSVRGNLSGRLPDMCGIAGKLNFDPSRPVDREQLVAMTTAVSHRGPDADGYYLGAGVGPGHRRRSIIDLATGDQPLATQDRT